MNKVNLNVLVWSIIFGFALYGASVFNTVPAVAQNTPPELFPYVYPHGIDDDMSGESSGNNNGIIEAGETIELTLTLSNWGEENATGVYAWVDLISRLDDPAVSDPYVTLLRGGQNTPLHFRCYKISRI